MAHIVAPITVFVNALLPARRAREGIARKIVWMPVPLPREWRPNFVAFSLASSAVFTPQ